MGLELAVVKRGTQRLREFELLWVCAVVLRWAAEICLCCFVMPCPIRFIVIVALCALEAN